MAALLNRARMTTTTTGTGTVTLGSAVTGYASFAEAGAVNATVYSYCIEDGDDFEIGVGTYTSSGTTFSRDTVTLSKISGTSGTTKIDLSGTAEIFITLRSADPYLVGGTDVAIADGGTGASTASAAFDNLKQAASDTATGVVELAVQSEMETGTDTTRAVVPGRQHYHPSAAKFWAIFDGTGTPAIDVGYNASSITDNGTGDWTVNLTTAFSSANWSATGSSGTPAAGTAVFLYFDRNSGAGSRVARTASAIRINSNAFSGGAATDSPAVSIMGFGDQ